MARSEIPVDEAWIEEAPVRRGDASLVKAAYAALDGKRNGFARLLPFLGPAFIASVAYMDPGNFSTNIQGGAQFGYKLLWVITAASIMAAFLQALSAKLGIATDTNLPALCHRHLSRRLNITLWVVSELAAMATDLAEFMGAALGFNLLFHLPLLWAALLTGVVTFAILSLQRYGFRPIEAIITALVGAIAVAYILETVLAHPDPGQIAYHALIPSVSPGSIFLIVSIIGATVMPHVLYLHSALTENRVPARQISERKHIFKMEIFDILIAMSLAAVINGAMMFMAASVFHAHGLTGIADLQSAYQTLTPLLGSAASVIFGLSLLASGISSSVVGTMAGQVIMQGFLGWTVPIWARRAITMLPAIVVIWAGANPTWVILISQTLLSFTLVAPIGALLYFTARRDIMGALVNRRGITIAGYVVGAAILGLNIFLLGQTFGVLG